MGYLGEEIKKLGFGLMRLPQKDGKIDIEQTKVMVDKFLDAGFTYFDTAWAYAGSEDAIRQALVERYPREKFQLATKNAAWINCKTREEAIAQFDTSLKQTGAGYFDFYLLHNLGESRTKAFDDFDMWSWIQEMKAEGKIKHIGFSFHSTPEELEEILTKHPEMEFVQLQINYADWENPAIKSKECYEVARKHGKPVIIMEPVKGGMLANPPEQVQKVFKEANPDASVASWAIKFAASLEGVITVLSGMSNIEQMEDNISYMKDFTKLSDKEEETINKAQEILKENNINVRVIDMHTIKPIDKELIIKCAKETKRIITIEDHSIIGGLGTAVCEVLAEEYPTKVERMGIKDSFGRSGKAEELMSLYKIDSRAIVNKMIG